MEQKNWWLVRRLVGYDRYSSREALETLNRLYGLVDLYTNFFQPVLKLVGKGWEGARVHKRYDVARTPYQRALGYGVLEPAQEARLGELYRSLNPVRLRAQVEEALERVWPLADRPHLPPKSTTVGKGVTLDKRDVEAALPSRPRPVHSR